MTRLLLAMPWLLLAATVVSNSAGEVVLDRPVPELRTGGAFASELEATVPGAVWQRAELRRVLRRLGSDRGVAVLLDRRVDPNQPVTLEVSQQRVRSVLGKLAELGGAEISATENVVFAGPPAAARILRTLIELRSAELQSIATRLPRERRANLFRRTTVHWNDLDAPREILERLLSGYNVELRNPDAVPHDLWAGATLPYVSLPEALSLVLVQLDLTFRWSDDGRSIELVPIPEQVAIEKSYRPRGGSAESAAAAWTREFEQLTAEAHGGRVVVRGTVEQHEAIARKLTGGDRTADGDPRRPRPTPLANRTFTIRQEVTAAGLIATLEKSGVEVEYDAAALEAAGIDLESAVTLDLKQAGAEEFFRAWCRPLGLEFAIEGVKVRLSPR